MDTAAKAVGRFTLGTRQAARAEATTEAKSDLGYQDSPATGS
jgi:hypothetical protein